MITTVKGQTIWTLVEPTLEEITGGNYTLPVNFKVVDVNTGTYKIVSFVQDSVNGARKLELGGSNIKMLVTISADETLDNGFYVPLDDVKNLAFSELDFDYEIDENENVFLIKIKDKPNVFPEVSEIQKGIVNNTSLQELGGVDKLINGVRVGTGNGTATERSTVLGKNALSANTSGENNNAIGRDSLRLNTVGSYNTAVGNYTLSNNISGNYNTMVGAFTGHKNTTGYNNNAFGTSSLYNITTGNRNTAIGNSTGYNITTGSLNFIAGNIAGASITTGSQNICIGQQSGKTITNGSQNICIGSASGTSSSGTTTANGAIADGISNIFIGTNIGLYGGLSGVNNSHYLIIHNYRNDGVPIVDGGNPLIKGHFVDRWLTIGGKLSVIPTYMPIADTTYTKNIVAKPDGTFGWEDKKALEINVSKRTTFPSLPNPGDLFFNTTDNKHYGFDGTSWNALY